MSRTECTPTPIALGSPAPAAEDAGNSPRELSLYRCRQAWADLRDTGHPDVRFCGACARNVFRARDVNGFLSLAASDRCVWVQDDQGRHVVGVPAALPDYDVGKPLDWSES